MTGRAVLRAGLVLLAVAALGWGAASAATTLSSETRVITQRHTDIRTVEVHAGMGVVGVTGQPSATAVGLSQRQRWRLRTPRFSARVVGDRLVVRSSCPWNVGWPCEGALDLVVPPGTTVDVRSDDGEVFVQGLTGSVRVRGGDGPITGTALRAADIDIRAGDGAVDVSFIVAPRRIRVVSADGPVEIRVPRDGRPWRVDGDTDEAPREVEIAVDPAADRTITADTVDGPVRITYVD